MMAEGIDLVVICSLLSVSALAGEPLGRPVQALLTRRHRQRRRRGPPA
jgi:hypothetical protein